MAYFLIIILCFDCNNTEMRGGWVAESDGPWWWPHWVFGVQLTWNSNGYGIRAWKLVSEHPNVIFFQYRKNDFGCTIAAWLFHSPCLSELFIVVHADHLKLRLLAMLIHSGNNRTLNWQSWCRSLPWYQNKTL